MPGIRGCVQVVAAVTLALSVWHSASATDAYPWHLPRGLPVPRVPADNPMSEAKVDLGRRLFYDTRFSGAGTYACASCHVQAHAFTDGRAHALGAANGVHRRSAMSLTNVAYNLTYGWADAGTRTLEAQMAVPMFNEQPIELGLKGHEAEVMGRFAADTAMSAAFQATFPGTAPAVTLDNAVKAIASFERTLVSGDSPFDRYLYRDDRSGMSDAALRGKDLFFSPRTACSECHATFNLSGPVTFVAAPAGEPVFHNTGLFNVDGRGAYPASDRGLIERTGRRQDMGRFRAPTLRNIAVTAPYMHDGSVATLRAAVIHYAQGGVAGSLVSDRIKGFTASDGEVNDLIAFLESLTDTAFLTNRAFGPPPARRGTTTEQLYSADAPAHPR